jgi:hypothetical protein
VLCRPPCPVVVAGEWDGAAVLLVVVLSRPAGEVWGKFMRRRPLLCCLSSVVHPRSWICSYCLSSSSLVGRGGEEIRRGSRSSSWMVVWGPCGAVCVPAFSSLELSSSGLSAASVVIPLDPVGVGQLLLFYMYKGHV